MSLCPGGAWPSSRPQIRQNWANQSQTKVVPLSYVYLPPGKQRKYTR
jgi:hypothetical protein